MFLNKAVLCEHYSAHGAHVLTIGLRVCYYAVVWSSGGVLGIAEDNVHRHRTSWLLNFAPSSETIANSVSSSGQLTFSGHFHGLLDSTTSTTSSFLSALLALLLTPSIHFITHPPTHSSIHSHIYTSSIHPPTHSSIHPHITHHSSIHQPIHPGT